MTQDSTTQLNPQQRLAVTAPEGATLIFAGPGSGKTRVLAQRIAYLIQQRQVSPHRILAVTFTNKAGAEMRHRVGNLLGGANAMAGLLLGTFHATCARLLRIEHAFTPYKQDFVIYDTDDQVRLVENISGELNLDSKKYPARALLNLISSAKNELQRPQEFEVTDYFSEIASRVYVQYQRLLVKSNAMDFDDLLMQMTLLLRENDTIRHKYQSRFEHVLVDEFQDTNTAQYQLVALLGAPQNNIFVVGDEDQSIYAFRGADYRNVERFRRDHPKAHLIKLEENYRSTQHILDIAKSVIAKNDHRIHKELFTQRGSGEKAHLYEAYDDSDEARFIVDQLYKLQAQGYGFKDVAIIYRTNAQSRSIETTLRRQTIPYRLIGALGFFQRREIKDLIGYLRVVNNPDDRVSFERIVNTPKRGIGEKSVSQFFAWTSTQSLGVAEALAQLSHGGDSPLSGRSARLFTDFGTQLIKWRDFLQEGTLVGLLDEIIAQTQYRFYLHEISDTPDQRIDREENVQELRALLAQADDAELSLGEVLADWALMTDADKQDDHADAVRLMTLHASKGLEYPIVFITGIEQAILPHSRSLEDKESLQEERRLFYVGITRAKDRLYLSYARNRYSYNGMKECEPSVFLQDIPAQLLTGTPNLLQERRTTDENKQKTTWNTAQPSAGSGALDRLRQDLAKARETSAYTPNPKFEGKIIPFPNGATSQMQYRSGMTVMHAIFGEGTVVVSTLEAGEEWVTVAFQNKQVGIKKLMSSIANLAIIK